jgi:hypothetical protein
MGLILAGDYSPHSFRATGITNYLENGGTLEVAQRIAGHADSRTTKLYDRRGRKSFWKTWKGSGIDLVSGRGFESHRPLPAGENFQITPKCLGRVCKSCLMDNATRWR